MPTPSSTTTSSSSNVPTAYVITTHNNTPLPAFKDLISSLPDGGTGEQIVFPMLTSQAYLTLKLTADEATQLLENPIVLSVLRNDDITDAFTGTAHKRSDPDLTLERRGESADHLRLISQQSGQPLADYLYDPILGQGTFLYIIDLGFNENHFVSLRQFKLAK
jgi:hypothetical protein